MVIPSTLAVLTGPSPLHTDCLNVVRRMARPWQELHRTVHAALVKKAQGLDQHQSVARGIVKVKAHRIIAAEDRHDEVGAHGGDQSTETA